jgi:cytochrome oxidase Cu insertion factor (SCO1/SenC/PrrC family)
LTLRDSSGHAVTVTQFRGEVVALSFLYTQCPGARSLTAKLLRHADEAAGHPQDVVYVAVSVDPFRDNADTIAPSAAGRQEVLKSSLMGISEHHRPGDVPAGGYGTWRGVEM